MQQLRAKTKSLTFPPLSTARYSFILLSQQGCQWRERKCPIFETVAKEDSNPGSLDCESGVLPLSYCAPYILQVSFLFQSFISMSNSFFVPQFIIPMPCNVSFHFSSLVQCIIPVSSRRYKFLPFASCPAMYHFFSFLSL